MSSIEEPLEFAEWHALLRGERSSRHGDGLRVCTITQTSMGWAELSVRQKWVDSFSLYRGIGRHRTGSAVFGVLMSAKRSISESL